MPIYRRTLPRLNQAGAATAIALAAGLLCLCGASAQAGPVSGLQGRDLNGDGQWDAFYDGARDISWLATASGSRMVWGSAKAWAEGPHLGLLGWRLPTALSVAGDACWAYHCVAGEMGHLWYDLLGNTAMKMMVNSGEFSGLGPEVFWTGSELPQLPDNAYYFLTSYGSQNIIGKGSLGYALAVHQGDVGLLNTNAVPEPQHPVWLLLGLLGLASIRRPLRAYADRQPNRQAPG